MIWFLLIAVIFFVTFCVFAFSLRWESNLGAVLSGVIACAFAITTGISLYHTLNIPETLEKQEVYVLTEDGVLKKANTTYYQDENGDWYVQSYEDGYDWKIWIQPFYEPEYEKVDAPVFENGNFVIDADDTKAGSSGGSSKTSFCVECGKHLNAEDKFCSDCGTKTDK